MLQLKQKKINIFDKTLVINEAETLIKYISCQCECKFKETCNSNKKM